MLPEKINYIVRELPPESTDFSFYFEDDNLTEAGGDYCYNLFIVYYDGFRLGGFNIEEYKRIQNEIEELLELYDRIIHKSDYTCEPPYFSVSEMLYDYGLIDNKRNTKRIKEFKEFFEWCDDKPLSPYSNYHSNFDAFSTDAVAKYLTLKTGKQWQTDYARGYCQGDYVEMVYCPEHYKDGVKHYGEIWLGAGKEFYTIELDENGEEADTCYGYIIADSQAWHDEDYKRLVCEWAGIPENETQLEMIDGSRTYTKYSYRTV